MENNKIKKINILILNYDWRNIYQKNYSDLVEKLKRDKLGFDINDFLIISWSTESYSDFSGNIRTVHIKAPAKNKIICDFLSVFIIPFVIKRARFKADLMITYDFSLALSLLLPKIISKSKILLFLTNLPQKLAIKRKFGAVKYIYQSLSEFIGKGIIDHYLVISLATENYLERLGIEKNNITRIVQDVILRDEEYINASKKGMVREKFQIDASKKIILSVGRLEEEKCFDDLIGYFAESRLDDAVLIIAGEGSKGDELKRLAEDKGVKKDVIFAGNVSRKEIWNYYNDADLFVLLSRSEGLGLVFWEAMYMGVPVIGRKIDGIIESIGTNEERGFFIDKNDGQNSFNQAVQQILTRNQGMMLEEKSVLARKYVQDKLEESQLIINNYNLI